jgi:hypothetical protein
LRNLFGFSIALTSNGVGYPNSLWYSTARLFRQPAPGDWVSVVNRLIPELEKLVQVYDAQAMTVA